MAVPENERGAVLRLESARIAKTRRSQRVPWKWITVLVPLAIAVTAPVLVDIPLAVAVSLCSAMLGASAAMTWFVGRGDVVSTMTAARGGSIELTATELIVRVADEADQSERFARSAVAGGWLEIAHGSDYLVLQMRSGVAVRAGLAGREAGERMLDELGLARDPRAMTLRLGSPQPTELGGVGQRAAETVILGCTGLVTAILSIVGLFALFMGSPRAVVVLLFMPCTFHLYQRIRLRFPSAPTIAHIGSEGVELVRRGRRRWISFTDLESVARTVGEVVEFRLPGERQVAVTTASAFEADALVGRVRAAQAWSTRGSAAARLGELDRGERTHDGWRSALVALTAKGAASYRKVAIDAETLAQVVEDAAAPAERRVAAAFALASASGEEALLRRVRIAAEATASEPLRLALERAAEGELEQEAVEAALAESRERARSRHTA
ncbi:hypothetical protein SCE1572_13390 [Sorangium cellulosum So0157-2]|uniref:Uncharacterized protein n=1 Tax=Sorangium cellulosum So0157-2 TaxID=1254432 RepID=S4XU78_SORCE|nr:hypothetical protein SCE1572_13390 [Sorangium cellulosum So0157-2]